MTDPIDLALAAFYRAGAMGDPCRARCDVWDRTDPSDPVLVRSYVTVADHRRLLAVYRVRRNGRLFRLKRWPTYLNRCAGPNQRCDDRRSLAKMDKALTMLRFGRDSSAK